MIEITLYPSGIGRYVAVLPSGRQLVEPTRQPFRDSARALLEAGTDPGEELIARHRSSAVIARRSTLAEAARWMIKETDNMEP